MNPELPSSIKMDDAVPAVPDEAQAVETPRWSVFDPGPETSSSGN
ncbi:MAG: hypothetical protein PHV34_24940 [Verrucomicrobiae bacterium]|nr:hypothetical protein [Verrucomicrobiae bacterium]